MPALDRLAERQLIVVTGKGGTGKTTLSALLGRLLSLRGLRVLLLEVDPRESLHQALGTEPSGGRVVEAGRGLRIQNLQPEAVIEALVREKVPIGYLAKLVTESPAFHTFIEGAPGLKETALLGHAYRSLEGADIVVVDAPATGHSAALLAAPGLLAGAVRGGQLGAMAAELAGFLADPNRCGVTLATLAEEMPVQETLELIERLPMRPELVVANMLFPRLPRGAAQGLWKARRRLHEAELARLAAAWDGPLLELPMLALDRGPELVERLASVFLEVDR
ncbi:ArsA-related P-loop ATPase [Geothrix sp. 21YS21S-2]|uniref:ArsA-related P-loop ATPase n=1 Tax=Geothrix sp. 21YS21S-2 TaxID=3068893 RepID=UPI0027B8F685|nr:ArsA-related P-loop ATPase [Geothrix sp. 21YS21S-2]